LANICNLLTQIKLDVLELKQKHQHEPRAIMQLDGVLPLASIEDLERFEAKLDTDDETESAYVSKKFY